MRVIVVAGGDPLPPEVRSSLPDAAMVIAADSGADHAAALGLTVDVLVGDLDSISSAGLEAARDRGARVDEHPAEKDATDLELALDAAVGAGATEIVLVGGHGGRLDHLLANCALLASPRYAGIVITGLLGEARVYVTRGGEARREIEGNAGELVTLVATHGPARGVSLAGLRYPLNDEDLPAGTSRGVSNVFESTAATVELREGTLLVIVPGRA